jgi:hypothetical protein
VKPLQILSINLKPLKEQTILKFCVKMMRKRLYVLTLLSSSCAIRSSTEHRIAHRLRCSCRCVDATHLSTHLTGGTFLTWLASLPQEVAIKLPISILFFSLECGGVLTAMRAIAVDLRERPVEWAQLAVPAMLYTLQNTMLYVGFANVEAAVGQVTYQSKILWTALFFGHHPAEEADAQPVVCSHCTSARRRRCAGRRFGQRIFGHQASKARRGMLCELPVCE